MDGRLDADRFLFVLLAVVIDNFHAAVAVGAVGVVAGTKIDNEAHTSFITADVA